jgi:aquaporin Z
MQKHEAVAGLVIGFTLVLVHLMGIGLTGTSVNPARSIGPAIFGGATAMKQLWLFIVAPLAGAALAAITAKCMLSTKDEQPKDEKKSKASK